MWLVLSHQLCDTLLQKPREGIQQLPAAHVSRVPGTPPCGPCCLHSRAPLRRLLSAMLVPGGDPRGACTGDSVPRPRAHVCRSPAMRSFVLRKSTWMEAPH